MAYYVLLSSTIDPPAPILEDLLFFGINPQSAAQKAFLRICRSAESHKSLPNDGKFTFVLKNQLTDDEISFSGRREPWNPPGYTANLKMILSRMKKWNPFDRS